MPHEPTKEQVRKTVAYLTQESRDLILEILEECLDLDLDERELLKKLWVGENEKDMSLYVGHDNPVLSYLLENHFKNKDAGLVELLQVFQKYLEDMNWPSIKNENYSQGKLFVIARILVLLGYEYLGNAILQWALIPISRV